MGLRRFLNIAREKVHGRLRVIEQRLRANAYKLFYDIGRSVGIARGCRLWGRDIRIGDNVMLDWNTCVVGPVSIGSNIYINQQCIISQGVVLEDNVGIGYNSVIFGDSREVSDDPDCRPGRGTHAQTVIERGVMIGARVTVMPGVRVGRGAVIAAGSVVNRDCEPNCLYAGVPARKVKALNGSKGEPIPIGTALSGEIPPHAGI